MSNFSSAVVREGLPTGVVRLTGRKLHLPVTSGCAPATGPTREVMETWTA